MVVLVFDLDRSMIPRIPSRTRSPDLWYKAVQFLFVKICLKLIQCWFFNPDGANTHLFAFFEADLESHL